MEIPFKELDIHTSEEFKNMVLEEIISSKNLFTLDFEKVEKIDLNSIQLLLSLKKYCNEKEITLTITNIKTKQIKQLLKMFDLNTILGVLK